MSQQNTNILTDFFGMVIDKGDEYSDRWLDREFGSAAPPSPTVQAPTYDTPIQTTSQEKIIYVPMPGTTGGVPVDKRVLYATGIVLALLLLKKLF